MSKQSSSRLRRGDIASLGAVVELLLLLLNRRHSSSIVGVIQRRNGAIVGDGGGRLSSIGSGVGGDRPIVTRHIVVPFGETTSARRGG